MKRIIVIFLCVLTTIGCAGNRDGTRTPDDVAKNKAAIDALLCGFKKGELDSSGNCDFSKQSKKPVGKVNSNNHIEVLTVDSSRNSHSTVSNSLIYACGTAGMSVNFVTGNCINNRGIEVNPRNVVSPSTSLTQQLSSDLIMRCGALGKSADFVTGKCM